MIESSFGNIEFKANKKDKKENIIYPESSYASRFLSLESERKEVLKLPKEVAPVVSYKEDYKEDIDKLQNVSLVIWQEIYDPKKIKKIASSLAKGKYSKKETKEAIEELIQMRSAGQTHREAWRLFDESHKPPKALNNLVVTMGKVKDHPEKKKYARKLINAAIEYNKKMSKINGRFERCKKRKFKKYFRRKVNEARGILTKKELEREDAHIFRKRIIRTIKTGFLLKAISDEYSQKKGVKKTKEAYLFFQRIDRILGKMQDERYKIKRKKGKKHKKYRKGVVIDDDIKKQLFKAFDNMGNQWGSNIKDKKKNKSKRKKKN